MKIITFLFCSWIFLMGILLGYSLNSSSEKSSPQIERKPQVESLEYRPQKQNPKPLIFTF